MQICITSNRKPVISNKSTLSAPKFCLFGLLNCRSVRNKYLSIKDYVVDKDFDIFAITETWLNTGDYDNLVIGSLIPMAIAFYTLLVMEEVVALDCFSKVRCQLLIQLIILFSLLDYLPVLAFVTRHWTGFVHIYLIALSMSESKMCLLMCMPFGLRFFIHANWCTARRFCAAWP